MGAGVPLSLLQIPGVGQGQTCELQDLVIEVGHSLIMHHLASEDKLQAALGQELMDLSVGGRQKAARSHGRARPRLGPGTGPAVPPLTSAPADSTNLGNLSTGANAPKAPGPWRCLR